MKSLSINGHNLHEVEMLLVPYNNDTVAYLRYPKHRIMYEIIDVVTLKIPSMLALELFRQGVLSQTQDAKIFIGVSGKKIGSYFIDDFRYPNNHSDTITIVFKKKLNLL
jgi:hypothetical protein